ncbi:DCAF8 [Bugula neritina]|uniref:DCAF8 n=1 Tax=Bugula neritina TaxID=10212 RepID=A0A7J7K8S4_BUGNE|nr:DCAF8 [Bugula neritina]
MRCVGTLDSHSGCVNALNFNQSGTYLASGSDDLKVVVWDMIRLSPYISFQSGHVSNVFQSKFMPHSNDSQIVTCARDGQVRLAELSVTGSCRETRKICEHADSCHKLAVETDPEYCLLSAGEDAMVFQIDVRSKKPNRLVQVLQSQMKVALYSIDKHPHKPYEFIVSGRDHYIRVYDKRFINSQSNSSDVVKRLTPSKFDNKDRLLRDVTCAVYNCNGSEIVGTYNDEDIYLFDNELPAEEACINTYTGHRNSSTVKGVNFYGPNSEYIVSGSDCGNVFFWDKTSSEPLQIQKGDEGGVVNVLEPHPHLPYLAVSGLDNSVKVFMPVGEKLTSMSKFKKLMKRNTGRQGSRMASNALIDTVERTFLMSALRAIHWRRRRREAGDDADADDADDESDEAESSVQCPVS